MNSEHLYRIAQLDVAISMLAEEVERQQDEARWNAAVAAYQARVTPPTPEPVPPAPAVPIQRIGFSNDAIDPMVFSPGATIRIR